MVFVYVFSIKGARRWGQFQFYTEDKSILKHILRAECKDILKADWSNAKSYLLPFNKPKIESLKNNNSYFLYSYTWAGVWLGMSAPCSVDWSQLGMFSWRPSWYNIALLVCLASWRKFGRLDALGHFWSEQSLNFSLQIMLDTDEVNWQICYPSKFCWCYWI